jgi:hypothetical protein
MSMRTRLATWWAARRPKPLAEQLAVTVDEQAVAVRVLGDLEPAWNQTFLWSDVRRVCVTDGGLFGSDLVRVVLREPELVVTVPLEAAGGRAFFGALCDRGLLPEAVWRAAMGETGGGAHCWPPYPPDHKTGASTDSRGPGSAERSI